MYYKNKQRWKDISPNTEPSGPLSLLLLHINVFMVQDEEQTPAGDHNTILTTFTSSDQLREFF
jgi:hypothetical protein